MGLNVSCITTAGDCSGRNTYPFTLPLSKKQNPQDEARGLEVMLV
jgi:hypothetical protein